MINVSAAMGSQFAEMASELIERVVELGPTPVTAGTARPAPPPAEDAIVHGPPTGPGGEA